MPSKRALVAFAGVLACACGLAFADPGDAHAQDATGNSWISAPPLNWWRFYYACNTGTPGTPRNCLEPAQQAWQLTCRARGRLEAADLDRFCVVPRLGSGLAAPTYETWRESCNEVFAAEMRDERERLCCPPGLDVRPCDPVNQWDRLAAEVEFRIEPRLRGQKPVSGVQLPPPPRPLDTPLTVDQIFEIAAPSVYYVNATEPVPQMAEHCLRAPTPQQAQACQLGATGIAVAITSDLLVTNCHVLAGFTHWTITHARWNWANFPVVIVYADWHADRCWLALDPQLLTTSGWVKPVKGVRFWSDLKPGEYVYALGNQLNHGLTVTEGVLSAKRLMTLGSSTRSPLPWIQSNAEINRGSYGAAFFDQFGNVIGLTTQYLGDEKAGIASAIDAFWPAWQRPRAR